MAKKKPDNRRPQQPREEIEDVEEIVEVEDDDAEEIVDIVEDDVVEVDETAAAHDGGSDIVEAKEVEQPPKPSEQKPPRKPLSPPQPKGKSGPQTSKHAGPPTVKRAAPTRVAPRQAHSTHLASQEELQKQTEGESTRTGQANPPTAAGREKEGDVDAGKVTEESGGGKPKPQSSTPPPVKRAAPTRVASRQAQSTHLASQQELEDLAASKDKDSSAEEVSTPEKSGAAAPREGEPAVPNMSLDESQGEDEAIEVIDEGDEVHELDVFDLVEDDGSPGGSSSVELINENAEKASGVDLIAEELESQVGREEDEDEQSVDEDEAVGDSWDEEDESSAVDLGGSAIEPGPALDIGEDDLISEGDAAEAGEGTDLEVTHPHAPGGGESTEQEAEVHDLLTGEGKGDDVEIEDLIDLELSGSGEEGERKGGMVVDEDDLLAAAEAEAAEGGADADGGETTAAVAPKKKTKGKKEGGGRPEKSKNLTPWLGGAAAGILLAVGLVAGMAFLQPQLLQSMLGTSTEADKPGQPLRPVVTPPSDLQLALEHINRGEFDQALEKVKDATDGEAERLSVRAQARWLKYLKDRQQAKAPLKMDDQPVANALADAKKAGNNLMEQQILSTITKDRLEAEVNRAKKIEAELAKLLKMVDGSADLKDLVAEYRELIEKKKQSDIAVTMLRQDKKALEKQVDQLQKSEQTVVKVLKDAKEVAPGAELKNVAKVVADALAEKQKVTTTLKKVNEKLKSAVGESDVEGVQKLVALRNQLEKDLSELEKAAKNTLKLLNNGADVSKLKLGPELNKKLVEDATFISEKAKAPLVIAMAKMVSSFNDISSTAAEWLQNAVETTALETQLLLLKQREKLIETPEKKLDNWIALLKDHEKDGSAILEKAAKDAKWLSSEEAKAAPADKAKAVFVSGLLARNKENFADARKHLTEAIQLASALKEQPAWLSAAQKAKEELVDPKVYYLPNARKLQKSGQFQQAEELLNTGLQALPDDPHLQLQRAVLHLEMAGNGKIEPALLASIRQDAQRAMNSPDTSAQASYVLGRLQERQGNLAQAKLHYETAKAAAAKSSKEELATYQRAIGRLILRDPDLIEVRPDSNPQPKAEPFPPNPNPSQNSKSKLSKIEGRDGDRSPGCGPASISPFVTIALLATTAGDVGGKPTDPVQVKEQAKLKKLIELAEEYKNSSDEKTQGQGYMLLGLAYSQMGKHTDGLKNYAKGLKLFHPGIEAEQLQRLIDNHPAFQIPDSLSEPNPDKALQHFGHGLHLYWDGEYQLAEIQFKRAIVYHKRDARFYYFLGLSQVGQQNDKKKRDAREAIRRGAVLEIEGFPSTTEVNHALERVQGPLRLYLNSLKTEAKLTKE